MTNAQPAAPLNETARKAGTVMGAGALVGLVAVILPWASRTFDASQISGAGGTPSPTESLKGAAIGGGIITAVLSVIVGLLAMALYTGKARSGKPFAIGGVVGGIIVVLFAIVFITGGADSIREDTISDLRALAPSAAPNDIFDQLASAIRVSIGIGSYVALVAGVLMGAGGMMAFGYRGTAAPEPMVGFPPAPPSDPPTPPTPPEP